MKNFYLLLIISLTLTACASTTSPSDQLANAPLAAAGLINADMAKRMASEDGDKIQQLVANSPAQSNETWKNKLTRDAYQFNSQRTYVNAQGQPCRDYSIKALIKGRNEKWRTSACRTDDGGWQAVNTAADNDA